MKPYQFNIFLASFLLLVREDGRAILLDLFFSLIMEVTQDSLICVFFFSFVFRFASIFQLACGLFFHWACWYICFASISFGWLPCILLCSPILLSVNFHHLLLAIIDYFATFQRVFFTLSLIFHVFIIISFWGCRFPQQFSSF